MSSSPYPSSRINYKTAMRRISLICIAVRSNGRERLQQSVYPDEDLQVLILLRRFNFAETHTSCIKHQTRRILPIRSYKCWRYPSGHSEGAKHQQWSLIITINQLVLLLPTGMCGISSIETSGMFPIERCCVDTLRSSDYPMKQNERDLFDRRISEEFASIGSDSFVHESMRNILDK